MINFRAITEDNFDKLGFKPTGKICYGDIETKLDLTEEIDNEL